MTGHQAVQWLAENWVWILIAFWLFSGSVAGAYRRSVRRHRKAAEIRHRRRVEIELARQGVKWKGRQDPSAAGRRDPTAQALPAAVIASPPGARPIRGVPGPCQHEQIIPVIGMDGELKRWVCANHLRCPAEFEPDIAIYEPDEESS